MSKLRIIGGALIVLFLTTIIALAIIAINLTNLSMQQKTLATELSDLKSSLSNSASGTVLTGTDTNVGPADEPITQTPENTESNQATTEVYVECSSSVIGVKIAVLSSWHCAVTGDAGYGQGYITLTKGDAFVNIGTGAKGFNCDGIGGGCTSEVFFKDDITTVNQVMKDNQIVNFAGNTKVGNGGGQAIYIESASSIGSPLEDSSYYNDIKLMLTTLDNL